MSFKKVLYFLIFFLASCTETPYVSEVRHIVHMGQSLGAGEQSLPVVTDTATGYGNLKFKIGTHTWAEDYYPDEPSSRRSSKFNLVSLTANRRKDEGETIANGLADHFSQESNLGGQLLFSYAGQGGRYLRELDKRHDDAKDERTGNRQSKGGYYKTSIDDVRRAKVEADKLGVPYDVMAITWMQGEANNTRKVNRWSEPLSRSEAIEAYKSDLINLKTDYDTDISKILGKAVNVPFFTYQTGGTLSGTAQDITAEETDNIFMVGPTYMLPNAENTFYDYKGDNYHGDDIHLTADAERWLGEQFGKVIKRVVDDKEDWKPLKPIKSYYGKKENEVYIKFYVPRKPLVLDTTFLPKQGNSYGFQIYDADNKVTPIKAIEVVDGETLKLITRSAIKGQSFVRYATRSYVKEISKPVYKITEAGLNKHGHKEVHIIFEDDIVNEFSQLLEEGVFYLGNRVKEASAFTNLIVREAYLNKQNNTVLVGEVDDLRQGIPFKAGQNCYLSRRFAFGNLRDSDPEKAIFKFSDNSYGNRAGKNYPLYNWCIVFQDLMIEKN